MTVVRFLALGLIGAWLPLSRSLWPTQGESFAQWSLGCLIGLNFYQFLTVPAAMLTYVCLLFWRRTSLRPPGYLLGCVTFVSGTAVLVMGVAVMNWLIDRPIDAGVGDPDGGSVIGALNTLSGLVTMYIAVIILVTRFFHLRNPPEPAPAPPTASRFR